MNSALAFAISLLLLFLLSYWERRYPLYLYELDRPWFKRLLILAILGISMTALIGFLVEPYLIRLTLFPVLSHFFQSKPNWLNGLISYFCITFLVYWWHRLRHHNNLAWRIFHQIHHSTHRLQAITAFYAHPSDFIANLLIISLVSYALLGLNIESASWATLWVAFFEYWEHTNIRTPHWLGYFIARPEMHRIHHERNRHANNYGLPIWDMLFGTYENTLRQVECGFEEQREELLNQMLACKQLE